MRTFAIGIAAAAFAGTMTAIPASAEKLTTDPRAGVPVQVIVAEPADVQTRYYSRDESTYAVLDAANDVWLIYDADDDRLVRSAPMGAFEPNRANIVRVEKDRDLLPAPARTVARQMIEERYYDADRETYAVFEPIESVWNVFDAATDELIDVFTENEYEPYEPGYTRVQLRHMAGERALDEPDRTVISPRAVEPGTAQVRYYDPDRRTYAVFDPVENVWNVFEAATGTVIDVLAEDAYEPYQPGYTVMIPGGPQVGMGIGGESIAADPSPISSNRQ